ncbi:MAG: cyanobactin biosynthesis PatC/TenC/TruC family protein [Spirulina sp.]
MPEQDPQSRTASRRKKSQTQPQTEVSETSQSPSSQPKKNPVSLTEEPKKSIPEEPKKSILLATGLENYAYWKARYKNHKRQDSSPFRRGRI